MGVFYSLELGTQAAAGDVLALARDLTIGTWVDECEVTDADQAETLDRAGFAPTIEILFEPHSPEASESMWKAVQAILGRFDGDAIFTEQYSGVIAQRRAGITTVTRDADLSERAGIRL